VRLSGASATIPMLACIVEPFSFDEYFSKSQQASHLFLSIEYLPLNHQFPQVPVVVVLVFEDILYI
jgi:hypothetical protein